VTALLSGAEVQAFEDRSFVAALLRMTELSIAVGAPSRPVFAPG
jgi:hypothetical protein